MVNLLAIFLVAHGGVVALVKTSLEELHTHHGKTELKHIGDEKHVADNFYGGDETLDDMLLLFAFVGHQVVKWGRNGNEVRGGKNRQRKRKKNRVLATLIFIF